VVLQLGIRSYRAENAHHHHDFAQLVVPISGRMDIDVEGRGGFIDSSTAALVTPGSVHSQSTQAQSRFLVLDCPAAWLEDIQLERLAQRIYVPISPATRRLIEFAELLGSERLGASAEHLAPLLLSSLAAEPLLAPLGLERLITRIQASPAAAWSNEAMAHAANMSLSQLHQRFRQLFDKTPQGWLAELRIREAQRWLGESRLAIADVALRSGFCDQAALTRAMHRISGTTPAAYRRNHQQPR
jgi:AraC-like DNA-binding protein